MNCDELFSFVPVTGTNTGTNEAVFRPSANGLMPFAIDICGRFVILSMILLSTYCPVPLLTPVK